MTNWPCKGFILDTTKKHSITSIFLTDTRDLAKKLYSIWKPYIWIGSASPSRQKPMFLCLYCMYVTSVPKFKSWASSSHMFESKDFWLLFFQLQSSHLPINKGGDLSLESVIFHFTSSSCARSWSHISYH